MKEYVGIYIKTEKAQEQDGFVIGNKMKYHFHITTVHKYHFFVFCLYLSCLYLCRVVLWKCMVFHFVAKAILFLCFFGFDIAISLHTLSFFKKFFIILVSILFFRNSGKFLIKYVMTILFHLQYWYFLQEWCPGDSSQNLLLIIYLLLQFLHPLSFLNMFLYYSCFDSIF